MDYRALNDIIVNDAYPMPRFDDDKDCLYGAKVFSSLTLNNGNSHLSVLKSDRHKTTFITQFGSYEWTHMPSGLITTPIKLQRMMDTVLKGLKWKCCLVCLDNIVVFSKSIEEHAEHLEQVFSELSKAELKLDTKKCKIGYEEVEYFGHVITSTGVRLSPKRVNTVLSMPDPHDANSARMLLGLLGYHSSFIANFFTIAEPIKALTRSGREFVWGPEQREAKRRLLAAVRTTPILAYPDFSKEFIVRVDASSVGVGATLTQLQDGSERIISYASRSLSDGQRRLPAMEREALAVRFAVKQFDPYLDGTEFRLFTDRKVLSHATQGKANTVNLSQLASALQEFSFEVVHKSSNADKLS